MTLDSGNISFMGIFVRVPRLNDSGVIENRVSDATSSAPLADPGMDGPGVRSPWTKHRGFL